MMLTKYQLKDIETAKGQLPKDKDTFCMKVGNKLYTDKKEAGTALIEMCKEIKAFHDPVTIGEYAGFQMAVAYDFINHKFVMNLKGEISHNLEIGSDPLGNITRINNTLEVMPRQLSNMEAKLETVEKQLETAKEEVQKPFAQEAQLTEKTERLAALNALLNMDETGIDVADIDNEAEADIPEQKPKPSLKEKLEKTKSMVGESLQGLSKPQQKGDFKEVVL